jgi:single-strand DNA-binding protein
MANLNLVTLIGRLTADPELRATGTNIPVTSFSIAVNRKTAKDGTKIADFLNIVAWRTTAEYVAKYFKKGQAILIVGSIQTRSYEDKEGRKRIAFEIVADEVQFAEPKRDGNDINVAPTASNFEGDFQELANDDTLLF